MKGNNRGRIFMSLINHLLCLSVLCLHPSCPSSLLPSHFKSHLLYHFTNPSVEKQRTRAIGIGEKEGAHVFLFIYLYAYPSCCFMKAWPGWHTETKKWICIVDNLRSCVHHFTNREDFPETVSLLESKMYSW